jgi:hypothetical protein
MMMMMMMSPLYLRLWKTVNALHNCQVFFIWTIAKFTGLQICAHNSCKNVVNLWPTEAPDALSVVSLSPWYHNNAFSVLPLFFVSLCYTEMRLSSILTCLYPPNCTWNQTNRCCWCCWFSQLCLMRLKQTWSNSSRLACSTCILHQFNSRDQNTFPSINTNVFSSSSNLWSNSNE